ncbi:MAG TPA: Crp/Fnr family transcriptional regulator [Streptosporangiaceae bacterium]
MIEVTAAALAAHPMLRGMATDHLAVLVGSASDVAFPAGHRLFEEGGNANHFWLLQSGSVALDLHVPGQGRVRIDSVGLGELLGWSWRFPPYRWAFGAVATSPVEAFEFDAQAVRASCASEPELGHEITERLALVLAERLQSTRVRLISAAINPVGTR